MKISDVDKNFALGTLCEQEFVFLKATDAPFELDGLPFFAENQNFCRIPCSRLNLFNENLQFLAWHPSGAQIRFRTNATRIALRATLPQYDPMSHITIFGAAGFDLYMGTGSAKRFFGSTGPAFNDLTNCIGTWNISDKREMREFTFNLPTYNGITTLEIGLDPEAEILPPTPFAIKGKVVFYGSSITQGGCCSRPGNNYSQMLSRYFDFEPYCLGFSGNAKGELEMAQLICEVNPLVFVYDYDHNAPDADHLQKTHEPFFRYIRERFPKLPVIMISKPDFDSAPDYNAIRREIIKNTYAHAVAAGDKRVFFIDGQMLFAEDGRDACTVDGCHPNDLGFYRMYRTVRPVMRQALDMALND